MLFRVDVVHEADADMDRVAKQAEDSIDAALASDEGHRGKRTGDVRLFAQFLDENRQNVAIYEADYDENVKFNKAAKKKTGSQ